MEEKKAFEEQNIQTPESAEQRPEEPVPEPAEKPREETREEADKDPAAEMAAERDLYLDKYQRTLAEFDNFRKRTSKEKASMYDDGVAAAITSLLPVVDNLERAVGAQKEETPLLTGVQMTLKQLMEILNGLGVTEIQAVGEKFDPNLHAAVLHEEDPEAGENEIVMELQKGYQYKDKVIRYSMVKVVN